MNKQELKLGSHIAFETYNGTRTGHRIGKLIRKTGKKYMTVKLADGVKMRIESKEVYGYVWFKKIKPFSS